ncbi:MAG TPA: PAS domain S-box protein [Bacillota bacterium]|nr:PAS domain S-box protein [Bacillota bacterium]
MQAVGWRYGMAVLAAVVALLVRAGLDPWIGHYQPWVTVYVAVLLVGWRVGWGPALVTALVGLIGGVWGVLPPRYSFGLHGFQQEIQILAYCIVAGALVLLMRWIRLQQDRVLAAAQTLGQQEQEFRASFEVTVVGEAQLDPVSGRFLRVNEALSRMTGYAPQELLEKTFSEITHPADRPKDACKLEKLLHDESQGEVQEIRFLRRDGQPIWVRTSLRLARSPAGTPWRLIAVVEDVTSRKEAEAALESERALSRAVIDSLPGLFYIIDEQMHMRRWNRNFEKLSGYSDEEVARRTALELSAPEDRPLVAAKIQEALTKGEAIAEIHSLTKDGRRIPYACTGKRMELDGEKGVIGLGVDITPQKRAEAALASQNARLELLAEAAASLLSSDNPEQILSHLYARIAQFCQAGVFLAYRANETAKVLDLESCGGLSAEARAKLAQVPFGQGICGTVALQHRPLTVTHIQQSDEPMAAPARSLGLRVYACSPLMAGNRLLGTLAFASCERDVFGPEEAAFFQTLASYVAIAKERVRLHAQLRQHAAHLEQTVTERTAKLREMMQELEHFSYSIVHDLRAPLRSVMSFAELLAVHCGTHLTAKGQDFLRRLKEAVDRMDQLITDALQYSWAIRSELPLSRVDVAALLRGLLESYPQFQHAQAAIRLEGEFPPVLGNVAGLTQCFSNLLVNAVKFVAPGTCPQVRIWAEKHSNQVRLWVQDNGIGISPENQEQIFEMFQRLHTDAYEGTGVGLALVRKVVERMGGRVGVESQPGAGSRFWLELQSAET